MATSKEIQNVIKATESFDKKSGTSYRIYVLALAKNAQLAKDGAETAQKSKAVAQLWADTVKARQAEVDAENKAIAIANKDLRAKNLEIKKENKKLKEGEEETPLHRLASNVVISESFNPGTLASRCGVASFINYGIDKFGWDFEDIDVLCSGHNIQNSRKIKGLRDEYKKGNTVSCNLTSLRLAKAWAPAPTPKTPVNNKKSGKGEQGTSKKRVAGSQFEIAEALTTLLAEITKQDALVKFDLEATKAMEMQAVTIAQALVNRLNLLSPPKNSDKLTASKEKSATV
tara:strand:- start:78 stop:938 length:861 start_codon:yes stop_codon:yes gene_type:complete